MTSEKQCAENFVVNSIISHTFNGVFTAGEDKIIKNVIKISSLIAMLLACNKPQDTVL